MLQTFTNVESESELMKIYRENTEKNGGFVKEVMARKYAIYISSLLGGLSWSGDDIAVLHSNINQKLL
jgi:truncated hemoglobin YjbI